MNILDADCGEKMPEPFGLARRAEPTILEVLTSQKQRLEDKLAKVNAGIEVLQKNSELASNLETLQKALRV